MSEIWSYFKNLFNKAESSSTNNPLVHELIERSSSEKEAYKEWKEGLEKRRLVDWINMEYFTFLSNPDEVDKDLDFLHTPMSKGFVVHVNPQRHNPLDMVFLLDYLKERVLSIGYKSYMSDNKTFQRGDKVENIQRHYLKPKPIFEAGKKLDQRYGNITIELLSRNDQLVNLKFSATGYMDHKFSEIEEFKNLVRDVIV